MECVSNIQRMIVHACVCRAETGTETKTNRELCKEQDRKLDRTVLQRERQRNKELCKEQDREGRHVPWIEATPTVTAY